jgi:hypothetical protein
VAAAAALVEEMLVFIRQVLEAEVEVDAQQPILVMQVTAATAALAEEVAVVAE